MEHFRLDCIHISVEPSPYIVLNFTLLQVWCVMLSLLSHYEKRSRFFLCVRFYIATSAAPGRVFRSAGGEQNGPSGLYSTTGRGAVQVATFLLFISLLFPLLLSLAHGLNDKSPSRKFHIYIIWLLRGERIIPQMRISSAEWALSD